nr:hypothetical protein [Tanacetum cinerariifolium]
MRIPGLNTLSSLLVEGKASTLKKILREKRVTLKRRKKITREIKFIIKKGGNVLIEKLLDLDSTKDLHPPHNVNPLSGSTTSSSPNHLVEEFVDELALITFPLGNDDLPFDIKSDLKEIEYLLHHDLIKDMDSILKDSVDEDNLVDLNDNLVDTMPEMFIEEHALDYSSPPLYDEYDDDLFEVEFDTEYVYDDPFDSKGEKIKESKLLMMNLISLVIFFLLLSMTRFSLRIFSRLMLCLQPTTRISEDFLEDFLTTNHQSGNSTISSHPNLTSLEVKNDVFDPEGGNVLIEKLLDLDSTKDLHP